MLGTDLKLSMRPSNSITLITSRKKGTDTAESLGIKGDEEFDVIGLQDIKPQMDAILVIKRKDGSRQEVKVLVRIDTPIEVDYYKHGGILPYVLRELVAA